MTEALGAPNEARAILHVAHSFADIAATTSAYVGAAVTEIATLRAELPGPQVG